MTAAYLAERDFELDGHVIHGLGLPTKTGDATRVDNTFVPLPALGTGSPGASFEAAPKDHVHPATPGTGAAPQALVMEHADALKVLQLDTSKHEVLFEAWRNFDDLGAGHEMSVTVWADMKRDGVGDGGPGGSVTVSVGATPAEPESGTYAMLVQTNSDTVARLTDTTKLPKPSGWQLCRLLATGGLRGKNFRVEFGALA